MKIDDYAWNKHEQKLKENQREFTYSKPKIKIVDNKEIRNKIEETLEKLSQKSLAQWSLKIASKYLIHLDNHLKNDERIKLGIETLEKRIEGSIRAYDLRKVGFIVNELAKESKSEVSKFAARSFAQAIATGHMRGHALVCSDYVVKLINSLSNNSQETATKERKRQLKILNELMLDYE
ncbi:putative immunity protein [Chengkuizengella axinellae]|uniref:Imm-5-like domain-containing protein n=1 Tax=Chengkuizengella axinellae TaxID=3064388 RepID=A0ABT9J638_9BACL|nr:hypothetical protein [Chengkuizengella sp. 2205SS18-9]MDP5277069.1 hypothetical protein [Chengkuizengella sp. 2205SS18-9]